MVHVLAGEVRLVAALYIDKKLVNYIHMYLNIYII